ncbi:hypothetical protein CVT24_003143 [Panaeolus cyanescens]|uniref:Timeless N-terminal domain-containing protein n=1 Tax=Panaeolus cyanescens TaxID=181874 RepID=A0A409VNL8_9AGAR|nr:hypothetical protein CVT24_003143 [Panaeolus cyanescens]
MDDEIIEISDGESHYEDDPHARRTLLGPVVGRVVDALGGYEGGQYVMGDQAYGCLKDLKKLWRQDDTDDERTVARLFWETRVLPNDLIPILLETAGKGLVEDKRAISCADLMTAMTWPIDMAEELRELDEVLDRGTDYTQLTQSHLHYKMALLKPGVMQALLGIVLPPLAKPIRERQERDGQVINVVLHLIRNLAFIKDLAPNSYASSDQAEFSNLQSKLIRALSETHILELLLTIAANTDNDPLYTGWNTLVLEILYLLLRGAKPSDLVIDQTKQAIHEDSGSILDITKRQRSKKAPKVDEIGLQDNLTVEARVVLQGLAKDFLEGCFNTFLSQLLKDIRSERPKITEKDKLRLLFVTKWFLEFFLSMRSKDKSDPTKWSFGLISEVTDRNWISWVLKRMRESLEEKPKLWTEFQAGMECLTQLILLIDQMSSSDIVDDSLRDAADVLQQQLIYNGEVLDVALESLRAYSPGTQSLVYLDSSVYLSYALFRMLEKWSKSKGTDTYVRQKVAKKKRKKKGVTEEEGIPDVEEEEETEEEDVIHETIFTLQSFEDKFAQPDITQTLLIYLSRYREFSSQDRIKRVTSLLHRQAVKAKAEGLFFKASTLDLFKSILADQKSFPREQVYKDLLNLINFILRQFFKALEQEPFLAVETFFPKNRGNWKQYSSREPETKQSRQKASVEDTRFPQDIEVKKGYSWSDSLGIAIAALYEANHEDFVQWTTEILSLVISQRSKILEEAAGNDDASGSEDGDGDHLPKTSKPPSTEALSKITDYLIPYPTDEQAEGVTKNPNLKLLFRLCTFQILDEDADEFEWYVPAGTSIEELRRTLNVIKQFMEVPYDLEGKKASELLKKKRRRRRRRSPSPSDDGNNSDEEPRRKKRKEKKKKEKEIYKSAQFIEDSDAEYGEMEAFLEKEKAQRERALLAAAAAGNSSRPLNMKATGTKKRRRKGKDGAASSKRQRNGSSHPPSSPVEVRDSSPENDSDDNAVTLDSNRTSSVSPAPPPRPRPRPIPKQKITASRSPSRPPSSSPSLHENHDASDAESDSLEPSGIEKRGNNNAASTQRRRLIISDDED